MKLPEVETMIVTSIEVGIALGLGWLAQKINLTSALAFATIYLAWRLGVYIDKITMMYKAVDMVAQLALQRQKVTTSDTEKNG